MSTAGKTTIYQLLNVKSWALLLSSSIAKKFIMGLSGLALAGFVMGHMIGNLLIFVSPDAYNKYGHAIVSNPAYPLISWGLVSIFLLHAAMGVLLYAQNRKARGNQNYAQAASISKESSLAVRTMIFSGSLIAVFLVTHIAGFKYGTYYSTIVEGVEMRDLHRLIIETFQQGAFVVWYLFALVLLGFHLKHGVSSCFQSLGLSHPRYTPFIQFMGVLYALVVSIGFISQPLYVYFFYKGI